jgi:hypothetical protein
MTALFYLYTKDRQRNAAVRDRLQGRNHVSRTIYKSSEHSMGEVKRAPRTNVIDLSMILLRQEPEGPAKAMSCVNRPEQGSTNGLVRDLSEMRRTHLGLHH